MGLVCESQDLKQNCKCPTIITRTRFEQPSNGYRHCDQVITIIVKTRALSGMSFTDSRYSSLRYSRVKEVQKPFALPAFCVYRYPRKGIRRCPGILYKPIRIHFRRHNPFRCSPYTPFQTPDRHLPGLMTIRMDFGVDTGNLF